MGIVKTTDAHAGTPEPPPPASAAPQWTRPLLPAAAYLAVWQVAPRLRTESVGAFLFATLLSLALIIWFVAAFARTVHSPRALWLNLLASGALVVPLRVALVAGNPAARWLFESVPGLLDVVFVWFAGSLGALLSRLLKGVNLIPPVAAVLALVDIWTVLLGGPVKQIMESENPTARAVTQAMTVQLPSPKAKGAAPIPAPAIVGFADFLFVAFFVAALTRFVGRPSAYRVTLGALVGTLCAYMLLVFFTGWNLPALIPMAIVMIGVHWRQFHYDRSELFALLYAGLFIALTALAFWHFARRTAPPEPAPVPARARE